MLYVIWDTHTHRTTGRTYKTRKGAQRIAHKLDTQYGAVRFTVTSASHVPGYRA